jgi:Transmembrane protein family 132
LFSLEFEGCCFQIAPCIYISSRDTKVEGGEDSNAEVLKSDGSSICQSQRFQSAVVDVYTRFVLSDVQPPMYLLHRKAAFRVTHLVKHQLRAADTSVARLRNGNIVDGVKPGRTEIQVM